VSAWRTDGRRRKEKALMVGQIGFYTAAAASSGWMALCKAGWLGLGGDIRYFFESFKRNIATVSTCPALGLGT